MAHALLAVSSASRSRRPLSPASMSCSTVDDSNSSSSLGHNSLRHQYSIASTSSTLYTCSEEDEDALSCSSDHEQAAACDEVIYDSRLNGAGLPVPWNSMDKETTAADSLKKKAQKEANHAMRFKRKNKVSRAGLSTLGTDWHPKCETSLDNSPESSTSPARRASQLSVFTPKNDLSSLEPPCACLQQLVSPDSLSSLHQQQEANIGNSEDVLQDEEERDALNPIEGVYNMDEQLDRMIKMTTDLLRLSKGVLASSQRISVAKASESQTLHSHEHALRQHLETLENQDRFMQFISNDAHTILNANPTDVLSPLSSNSNNARLPTNLSSPPLPPPPSTSRARLRPHSSNGSISAMPARATTMYINAEMMGGGSSVGAAEIKTHEEAVTSSKKANRERHASITSHGTGSSGLGSLKEETEELATVEGGTSTPAHVTRALSRKKSHLSSTSTSSSSVKSPQLSLQIHAPVASTSEATAASKSALTPAMTSANTTSSSTPSSSTFFSSFWSRSSKANDSIASTAASSSSYNETPETTMEASPSLSRLLNNGSKSGPIQPRKHAQKDGQKDARSMLSALAASPSKPTSVSSTSHAISAEPNSLPHLSKGAVALSTDSAAAQSYEARSPPLSASNNITTAALAQLSAIHSSSPHLTLCRPRHRASLSESLLRASWSNNNLKADASTSGAAADKAAMTNTGREVSVLKDKGHRRARHSTSPAVPSLPTVQVPIGTKR